MVIHPSSNFLGHYLLAVLSPHGVDVIGANTRYIGNDSMLTMENCVLDIGAVIGHLRQEGYERVVLIGNSGGGGLSALYQSQAEHPTITHTPAGDPVDIVGADLSPADALIELMAHPGRALVYTEWLDPAVTDESDPFRDRDSTVDMFETGNGPPYDTNFLSRYRAGASHITGPAEMYDLVNVIAFGGAADRATHVPTELDSVGPVVFWESTGAADALPFWNTNFACDVYLYLVHGNVRVEFKETEAIRPMATTSREPVTCSSCPRPSTTARSPETVSGGSAWRSSSATHTGASIGTVPIVPNDSAVAGRFRFELQDESVRISWPQGSLLTPRHFFVRGLAALVAYELHLEHNEFDGGFVVHDLGDQVRLKAHGYSETLPGREVLASFAGLLQRWR